MIDEETDSIVLPTPYLDKRLTKECDALHKLPTMSNNGLAIGPITSRSLTKSGGQLKIEEVTKSFCCPLNVTWEHFMTLISEKKRICDHMQRNLHFDQILLKEMTVMMQQPELTSSYIKGKNPI